MTPCGRWGHAWYVRRFGGIGCGRCGEFRSQFYVYEGKPMPYEDQSIGGAS